MGCDHVTEADDKRATAGLLARLAKAPSPAVEVDVLRTHLLRRARSKSPSWIDELAELVDECDLTPRVQRETISTLAWQARDVGQPLPTVSVDETGPVGTQELCRRYLVGFRLRFDFRFEALGEIQANVYFWRAYAFRRMERFDEAMESIDRAVELLSPGNNAIHQDYVRERALITTSKLLLAQVATRARDVSDELREEMSEQLAAAKAELRKQQEDAQRVVSDSLLKIIEILGLFIALAGFLVGSGIVAFRAAGFWQNFASMALVLVGSVLFFGLLRLTIRYRPRRR